MGFLLPPKEHALSTMGMNDGAGKLLPFFMGKQALSYSAIPELTVRLFTVFKTISIYPKREKLSRLSAGLCTCAGLRSCVPPALW